MRTFVYIFALLSAALFATSARAEVLFQDSFEGGFAPGWYGRFDVFMVTTSNAHTGQYSVTTNGMWHWLAHDLGSTQTNTTFECWFYDAGSNNEEHMIGASISDPCCGSQSILWIGLEAYFDRYRYMYGRGWTEISTEIPRTIGWHKATFYTDGTTTQLFIDDRLIAVEGFQAGWRYIVVWENSKIEEPHTPNFWDDVRVYTDLPVPALQRSWGQLKAKYR